jgi:M6 family metalloprotease-like protein
VPALGTRRIAILLVDTSSQRYTTDATTLQGHRDRWMNEIINGVTQNGVTRNMRRYFREVSYNNFDLSAQIFGPVSLPGTWDTCFESDGAPKGSYYQACFTAGDGLIDYTQFDTLLCGSQGVDAVGMTPAKSAWPYASIGNWGPYTTAAGNLNRGVISMPNEWGVTGDREIFETLAHELEHNLGLGDQYTPGVPARNVVGAPHDVGLGAAGLAAPSPTFKPWVRPWIKPWSCTQPNWAHRPPDGAWAWKYASPTA